MFTSILYNLPFLFALFCILSVIAINKPSQPLIRKALLIFLGNYAVLLFIFAATIQDHLDLYLWARPLFMFTLSSIFPLYYINIRLTTLDRQFNVRYLWIFVPAAVIALVTFIVILSMTPAEFRMAQVYEVASDRSLLTPPMLNLYLVDLMLVVVIFLETVWMVMASSKAVTEYKKSIGDCYADGNDKTRELMVQTICIVVLAIITMVDVLFLSKEMFVDNIWMRMITVAAMLAPILLLTFRLQKRQFASQECDLENCDKDKQIEKSQQNKKNPKSTDNEVDSGSDVETHDDDKQTVEVNITYIAERIVDIVEAKKLYLKTDLRITDVCDILSTNRTYISQAINTHLGGNFSDFINRYRLEEAKLLLGDRRNDNFTIESLAERAGFATAASMNRAFRKVEEMTPYQYRQSTIHQM